MADVLDVAKYALDKLGYVSTMKLQKIVFYSHAYHLVRQGLPLFDDRIEAWFALSSKSIRASSSSLRASSAMSMKVPLATLRRLRSIMSSRASAI